MGAFDDLVPGNKPQPQANAFSDLVPEEKGSYLSGDQGLIPDVAEDIGKGIYSGVVSVPQGIAELGAIFLDGTLGTNTSRTVTDAFEYIKPEMGKAGEVTEDLVAFGVGFIPIAGWLGRAGQAAKAAKAGKAMSTAGRGKFGTSAINFGTSKTGQKALGTWAGLTGSTAAAAMGYSTAVASDGRATLSDNFAVLPDALKTEKDTGLTGRQEAARRFRNKLRVGAEDAILSGVFDTALKGMGIASREIGKTETGAAVARGLRSAPSKVAEGFIKGLDTFDKQTLDVGAAPKLQKGLKAANQKFQEYFTASGGANQRLYETVQDARARADMYEAQGLKAAEDWDKAVRSFLKAAKLGPNKTPMDAAVLEEKLGQYLLGNTKALDEIGDEGLITAANKMIDIRSELDDRIIQQLEETLGFDEVRGDPKARTQMIRDRLSGVKAPETPAQVKAAKALKEMLDSQNNQNGYLRRMFEQYTDPVKFYRDLDLGSKEFDNAVQEVARHMVTGKGRAPGINDLAQARRVVYDSLGLQGMGGLPPEQALRNLRQSIIDKEKGKGFGLVARERPVLKSIDDIFVERKEILDISPNLRKLKGELTDPKNIYIRTINDMAQASAAADMYAAMRPQGLVSQLIPALESISKGGRPSIVELPDPAVLSPEAYDRAMQPFRDMARDQNIGVPMSLEEGGKTIDNPNYIKPEMVAESYAQQLRDAGYVQLGDSADIQHVFGGSYGDLTGMMVSPETYSALTAPLKLGSGFLGEVTGILSSMRSLSQKMTIVPSPGAQVRNIVGNMGMLAANANFGRETDFSDMLKIFTSSLDTLDEAGLSHLAKKLSLTGVADTSLVTRALREYRDAGRDLTVSGKLTNAIELFEDKIPFMKLFERIYGESDTFFKGLSLLGEEKKILSALDAANVGQRNPFLLETLKDNGLIKREAGATQLTSGLSNVEVMAGDIVKDTMPIYPRVGKAVRSIDMVPIFGNFTSFASENIRNSVNILDRGLKEMSFEISPTVRARLGDAASDELERQFRAIGAQRLMSYISVATIIPKSMVRGSMMATGTTDEQMAALYEQLPEYMDGHDVVILGNDGRGKIDYIDLSYVSPYAFVLDPAKAAMQKYNEMGKLDKNEAEKIIGGAWRGFEMFLEPFGEESMIFERIRDVLPSEGVTSLGVGRGGKTATGADVYSSVESKGDQFGKGIAHVMNGIIPQYMRLAGEFENVATGEFEPGRVYRAATGMPGKRGEEYNIFKEGARLVTGFTPMTADLRNDFAFKGLEYAPRRTDAKQLATGVMKRADATMEEMQVAWGKYLDNLYREQSKLYSDIQSARELGLSDIDIRRNLIQGANLSKKEVAAIMDGRFYPTAATRELAKDINALRRAEGRTAVENKVPFGVFNRLSSDRMNEPLARSQPTEEKPTAPAPTSNPFMDLVPQQQQPTTNPFTDLVPQRQGSLPVAPAPVQTASAMVNPIVLGNDPATQALAKSLGRSQ